MILYGWALQFKIHWAAPMVEFEMVGSSGVLVTIPAFAYLVDVFGDYSASAIAASVTLRCVTGTVMPLASPPLYSVLGQGWGNTVLALVTLALLPVPLLLIRYGESLRARTCPFERADCSR